jgi:hypothetical protein
MEMRRMKNLRNMISYLLLTVLLSNVLCSLVQTISKAESKESSLPPIISGTETRITTDLADQFDPAISGNIISYTDEFREPSLDIWYYDPDVRAEARVTSNPSDELLSGVSNGTIVYEDMQEGDVFAYSTITNQTINLSQDHHSTDPCIGQDLVAWEDTKDGNREVYAKNLTSGEERQITNDPLHSDTFPDVDNGRIVWQKASSTQADVYCYDWASGTTQQITVSSSDYYINAHIWRDEIVYPTRRNGIYSIYWFNLTSQVEKQLPYQGLLRDPTVSGDFVCFEELQSGISHLMLWHLPTDTVYQINVNPSSSQFLNDIDGNRVVYTDDRNGGQLDVYMFQFQIHDVAVIGLRRSKTIVGKGYSCKQNVTVTNQGYNTETFTLNLWAAGAWPTLYVVQTAQIANLLPGETRTVTMIWNTGTTDYENYTMGATANPLEGETDTQNNVYNDHWILVTIPGDIDGNHVVNILDVVKLTTRYMKPVPCIWPPIAPQEDVNCDINGDGVINILDIVICTSHYGQRWP